MINKLYLILPKMARYVILLFYISLSIIACDRSEQTKKKIIKEPALQNAGNKENIVRGNTLLTEDSVNIELMIQRASSYYAGKEYYKAIDHFLMAYNIEEKNLAALMSLGNLYYDTEQYKKAIEFYEKTLELSPGNLNVRCDMATCYARIGMLEKAIEINKFNIKMDFNHVQSHYNLAVLLEKAGYIKEANEEKKIYNQLISGLQK